MLLTENVNAEKLTLDMASYLKKEKKIKTKIRSIGHTLIATTHGTFR